MNDDELIALANAARAHSYSPYSGYAVGAVLVAADGTMWAGTNVENVSYGVCLCAERAALGAMVSAGRRELTRVVVTTPDGATPCGMCRQALIEFAPNPDLVAVVTVADDGERHTYSLRELVPHSFSSKCVG